MSGAPLVVSVALAAPMLEARVADLDGRGAQEVVLALAAADAERVTLTALSWGEQGPALEPLPALPPHAGVWDAGHGLWWLDRDGLRELRRAETWLRRPTGLPAAQSRSKQATLVHDLDHDGDVELLVPTADGVWLTHGPDDPGRWLAGPSAVALSAETTLGGQVLRVRVSPPALVTGDWDGDGLDDVLLVGERAARVHRSLPGGGTAEPVSVALPPLVRPASPTRPAAAGPDDEVTDARWADVTGDGRLDLVVHHLHSDGKLASTEARVSVFSGGAATFGPAQVRSTGAGSTELHLLDVDADGDLDAVLPQVSLDAGNLAQAVLRRTVDVQVTALRNDGGRLGPPTALGHVAVPVEDHALAWTFFADLTQDGLLDLAVVVDGVLELRPGTGQALATKPAWRVDLGLAATRLWSVDLDGAGSPELVAWAPGEDRLVVVQLP